VSKYAAKNLIFGVLHCKQIDLRLNKSSSLKWRLKNHSTKKRVHKTVRMTATMKTTYSRGFINLSTFHKKALIASETKTRSP